MNRVSVDAIARLLDTEEPRVASTRRAGVAVILEGSDDPRTLLIKRAEREGDPWSGQVAFPGGKMDARDGSALDAILRETMEEVGIDLKRDAALLGFFGSFRTHTGTMDVVPAVFLMKRRVEVKPNEEVSSCGWMSLSSLRAPESRSTFRFASGATWTDLPAIHVGGYVIWGLTLRMIESLLERAGPEERSAQSDSM